MRDDGDGAWEAWEMITGAACVRVSACVRGRLSVCVAATCHGLVKIQKLKDPHRELE